MRSLSFPIALAVMFLVLVAGAAAQHPAVTDEAIAREVTARLMEHDITSVSVGVASGIVTLRGTAATLWVKNEAREHALKSDDVITVINDITVPRGESDAIVAELVARRLQRYVFFSIFDDAEVEVEEGVVTLTGRVTMPYKAEAFADLAARVPGVQDVRNDIQPLPVSRFDDQLRYAVARRIYGDDLFARYAIQANPPVHIIVEHGQVTLTGIVFSEVERRTAEAIARSTFAVMGVRNKLRIELDQ
jgi:hyperosmotically inducible protein